MRLSARVLSMAPSATSRAANAAVASSTDEPPLDLGAGCPDWGPPPGAIEAAHQALDASVGYGRPGGDPALLAAVTKAHLGFAAVDGMRAIATCGGKEALFFALGAVVDPGDEVVVCAPYWPTFVDQIRAFGGVVRLVPAGSDGRPSLDHLRTALDGAKAVIVNTPGNPSGLSWSKEAAALVKTAALNRNTLIVVDNVYGQLTFGEASVSGRWFLTECPTHTVIVDGVSKRLAMPGLRVGWALGPSSWVDGMRRLQDASTTHPNGPAQAAALAGLSAETDWLPGVRRRLARRVQAFVEAVEDSAVLSVHPPTGGLFGLVHLPPDVDDIEFAERLSRRRALKCVPGSAFGVPGALRLALTVAEGGVRAAVARIGDEVLLAP